MTGGLLRDWRDGDCVDQVLLLCELDRRRKQDGAPFLRLTLGDRSGTVRGVMWQDASDVCDGPVRVVGRVGDHPRYGRQVTVEELRCPEADQVDWELLLDGPARPVEELERVLDALVASIADAALRELLRRVLSDPAYRVAPAVKLHHHAYPHGLLDHCVELAQLVDAACTIFGGIDRDVAIAGALLHDIGKLDAYDSRLSGADLNDAGKLAGEIPLGYYRVRREIESIPDFPPGRAEALLHIVLSHHGRLDHGSPVAPSTREATLVHAVDHLSGRLGAFDRLQKGLAEDQTWSRWDRVLDGPAYFAAR
jgi:3'-5' exoribonuclease